MGPELSANLISSVMREERGQIDRQRERETDNEKERDREGGRGGEGEKGRRSDTV